MPVSEENHGKVVNFYKDASDKLSYLSEIIQSIASGELNESEACTKYHVDKNRLRRFVRMDFSERKIDDDEILSLDFEYNWKENFMFKLMNLSSDKYNVCPVENFEDIYEKVTSHALSDMQKNIFDMRVKNELRLEEIAETYGLSRERIRQIVEKCFHILRRPKYVKPFIYGADYLEEMYLHLSEDSVQDFIRNNNVVKNAVNDDNLRKEGNGMLSGEELSTRARNSLYREGLLTVNDVKKFTVDELLMFPNIGVATVNEIVEYMQKVHDFTVPRGGDKHTANEKLKHIYMEKKENFPNYYFIQGKI